VNSADQKISNNLRQEGLSLVEMMIALVLSSVVAVGVVQLFVANSQTYKLLNGQSRMQESARFAQEFIGRSVRIAGYKGCYSTNDGIITTLDPPDNLPYEFDLRTAIEGFDGAGGAWDPAIDDKLPKTVGCDTTCVDTNVFKTVAGLGANNGIDTIDIVENTDILTTRNVSINEAWVAVNMPTSREDIVVTVPSAGNELELDHIAFIGDCEKGTLFRITDVTLDTPSTGQATIEHLDDDVDDTANTFEQLAEVNTFQKDAMVSAVESHTFYIASGEGRNNLGNEVFSLWRKSGTSDPVELVEGVENLQVLYGIDTDEDSTPNTYVTAKVADPDWDEVVTVRVSVTVNSVDDVGSKSPPTHGCTTDSPAGPHTCLSGETYDGLLRRTFTQTIHLRNHG